MVLLRSVLSAMAAPGGFPVTPTAAEPVRVECFYHTGCEDCVWVSDALRPWLLARYGRRVEWQEYDLRHETNYLRPIGYLERERVQENARLYVVVNGREILGGARAIRKEWIRAVDRAMREETGRCASPMPPASFDRETGMRARRAYMARYTLPAVILAGLSDGLNLCAFSSMLFLVSVLVLARGKARNMWQAGAAFCAAAFLTYLAFGLGLLSGFRTRPAFPRMRQALDAALISALSAMALASFWDAWRAARGANPSGLALGLPGRLRASIRRVIRDKLERQGDPVRGVCRPYPCDRLGKCLHRAVVRVHLGPDRSGWRWGGARRGTVVGL